MLKDKKANQFIVGDVGRMIYEDPRGHQGCLKFGCLGYLYGAKRYGIENLKQVRK